MTLCLCICVSFTSWCSSKKDGADCFDMCNCVTRNFGYVQKRLPPSGTLSQTENIEKFCQTHHPLQMSSVYHTQHLQTICTSLQTDNLANSSSLNFYRLDAVRDIQPTVSQH